MNQNIIFGIHAVESAIRYNTKNIIDVYCDESRRDQRLTTLITLAKKNHVCTHLVDSKKLKVLADDAQHQGVVAMIKNNLNYNENELPQFIHDNAFLLILDGVQDPHNLGAVLRTANAAGVDAIIAPKDNSTDITPVVRKVASGAAETTPFIQVVNLSRTIQMLQKKGVWIYGLDEHGEQTIYDANFKGALAIIMGAEGTGLRRLTKKHCDHLLTIPMNGTVESLNVSVATGIVLYEVIRQMLN